MCGLYTKSTMLEWLESQINILDCWIGDVSTNPDANMVSDVSAYGTDLGLF